MTLRRFDPRRLIDARERAHLTQEGAAVATGLSRATVQNAEGGRNAPSLDTLQRLASVYGCSMDWLFVEVADAPAPKRAAGGNGTTTTRRRARR